MAIELADIIKLVKAQNENQLDLNGCGIDDDIIQEVVNAINENDNITALLLADNVLTDAAIGSLNSLQRITQLNVTHNDISNAGALALIRNKQFTHLYLSKNTLIDNEIVPAILKEATQIVLNLAFTYITEDKLKLVKDHIDTNLKKFQEERRQKAFDQLAKKSLSQEEKPNIVRFFTQSTDTSDNSDSEEKITPPSSYTGP